MPGGGHIRKALLVQRHRSAALGQEPEVRHHDRVPAMEHLIAPAPASAQPAGPLKNHGHHRLLTHAGRFGIHHDDRAVRTAKR